MEKARGDPKGIRLLKNRVYSWGKKTMNKEHNPETMGFYPLLIFLIINRWN